jgi:kynurenine formamidase
MRIIDLSRELYHRTPSYRPAAGHSRHLKTHAEAFADSGNVHGNSVMYFSMPDHGGTHIDAPRHFGPNGTPINEYPLENCIAGHLHRPAARQAESSDHLPSWKRR